MDMPNMDVLSRDEFLIATQITSPSLASDWIAAVCGIVMSVSTDPETQDLDTLLYIIQQLGLRMPTELLMVGTAAITQAYDDMANGRPILPD